MIDELLGRTELKNRIEELKEEKHHLQRQLDAESDRRADAVSDKQQAEAQINRLEDKITELEDKLERTQTADDADTRKPRGTDSVRGERLVEILQRLGSFKTEPEGALTAVVENEELPLSREIRSTAGDCGPLVRSAAPTIYYTDDAGLVSVCLRPPIMPEAFTEWESEFTITDSWFRPTGRLVFGVLRADVFAVGVYEDGERLEYAGFETDVKSDHSKGGFSQGRFERIRNEQIDQHLKKARELLVETRTEADPDRTILTGGKSVLSELAALADHTATTDAGGKPRAALEDAFVDFWSTRVVQL